ncbi:MAG: MBL fold metallo-hydrolase, partial [Bacteroidetes bacterium]|nr:MBL fold metallo-hydrolase [Bacteroidota bacterium]
MEIKFCGAAGTVTGSRHLLTTQSGFKLLLDCGMYQGEGINTYDLNANFLFDPKELDALVISHAHIDHTGALPRLAKLGFEGPIYCTPPTLELCKIMLNDSAFIQKNDLKY